MVLFLVNNKIVSIFEAHTKNFDRIYKQQNI